MIAGKGPIMEKVNPNLIEAIEHRLNEFPVYIHPFNQSPMALHTHSFIELVYVRSGSGLHCHETQRYPIRKGDCFIVLPGDPHGYQEGSSLKIANILFGPSALSPYATQLQTMRGFRDFFSMEPLFRKETAFRYKLHCSVSLQHSIERALDRMVTEQQEKSEGHQIVIRGTLLQIIILLSRHFAHTFSSAPIVREMNAKENVIDQAVVFLENHFDKNLSIAEIADAVCLSAGRLAHVFRDTMGMSLIDYLTQIRLDHARQLLLNNPSMSISAIAFETGFHDPSYFARIFKKSYKTSPASFRKSAKKSS
jgi:AraC-like DNA-binding protein